MLWDMILHCWVVVYDVLKECRMFIIMGPLTALKMKTLHFF